MSDRIEEIKAYSKKGIDYREDVPFLIGEIERLKMMLDAAAAGQETMQRKTAERNENLRLDYLDAVAERDAAIADLYKTQDCGTCEHENACGADGPCGYEWRGVEK